MKTAVSPLLARYALSETDRSKLLLAGLIIHAPKSQAIPASLEKEPKRRGKRATFPYRLSPAEKRRLDPPLCARVGCDWVCKQYYHRDGAARTVVYGRLCVKHAAVAAANTKKCKARRDELDRLRTE